MKKINVSDGTVEVEVELDEDTIQTIHEYVGRELTSAELAQFVTNVITTELEKIDEQ